MHVFFTGEKSIIYAEVVVRCAFISGEGMAICATIL